MFVLRPVSAMLCRSISTSVCLNNMKAMISAQQQAKMMKKFMAAAKKRERQLMTPLVVELDPGDDSATCDPVRIRSLRSGSSRHRHRLEALSSIYLERITELLNTGELVPELLDTGLTVSRVQLSGNMRLLYVFWTCWSGADERQVSARLEDSGRLVRTALTQQRVTGHVPGVKFIRDLGNSRLQEVERRLALADFGPDFVPTDPTHLVKRQGVLGRPVTNRHTEQLLGAGEPAAADDVTAFHPPEMPHTAGGLNRAAILAEVEERLQKAAAPHRQVELHPEAVTPLVPGDGASGAADREQLSFERFTMQRKWARMRRNKVSSTVDLREWERSRRRRQEDHVEEEEEELDTEDVPPMTLEETQHSTDRELPYRS